MYPRPEVHPLLLGAVLNEETERFVGGRADGPITVASNHDAMKRVVEAFWEGVGAGKPINKGIAAS